MIPRTRLANEPRSAAWVSSPWGWGGTAAVADTVHEGDYPTHSSVLGPDGVPLMYEPRQPVGFDLRRGG
jgi:hypothetical protein